MSKVYQSVRGVVQETLSRRKPNFIVSAREKGSDAVSLNGAMEELEKILLDRIGRLKAAVRDDQAVLAGEVQHAEQVIESLRTNIAVLEAKLNETEEIVRGKDVAHQQMEESLSGEIRDLRNAMKEKEEALENRGTEVNDLKSTIDVLVKQVTDLELGAQQAKGDAATAAERAQNLAESAKARTATLEAQLRQAEQTVRGKDWTLKEIEQSLTAKIEDLENQVKNKEKLLSDRDRQITDLAGLTTNRTKEEPSLVGQAEALNIQAQDVGTGVAGEQSITGEENPPAAQLQAVGVTSNVIDASPETVSRDAFDRMIHEFGELSNVIGPIASLIVRDHVRTLGESMENFPRARLTELLDNLSEQIFDERRKAVFHERLSKL
jgi:chromosome segregation ATPase